MMEWESLRNQLELIWKTNVQVKNRPWEEWRRLSADAKSAVVDQSLELLASREGQQAHLFVVQEGAVSASERMLAELMLETRRAHDKKIPAATEEERKATLIRDWIRMQSDAGVTNAEMPDALVSQFSLYSVKIPILIYGDYSSAKKVSYPELKKLLESFFDGDIALIPLSDKEWLILGSDKLLSSDNGDEREYGEEESTEDSLAAIGMGLREMLVSDWLGESHVAIHYPMTPSKSLLGTVYALREAMMLGRAFHVGTNLHLPWNLHLEKLVYHTPEEDKADFLERVLRRIDVVMDAETMMTLEHFFSLDCNVSETAKKLYIHRNTLLYRLDKFKQETGLDVRTFNDAVLVKIALLLYKVTKRK